MKKIFTLVFFIFVFASVLPCYSQSSEPAPYEENEFHPILKDIRRAEIITFGSLPFVSITSALVYSFIRYCAHGFSSSYIPNPFSRTNSFTTKEHVGILLTSLGISFGIGITDLIVASVKRSRANKRKLLETTPITIVSLDEDFSNAILSNIKLYSSFGACQSIVTSILQE